jgi:lysophospholipase
MGSISTGDDLPKSNQSLEAGVRQMTAQPASDALDRRAIPPDAFEGRWLAPDSHAIRRLDWPCATGRTQPRGSLLFLPGRGDFYEKWLEAMGHWHARGWSVTALDWRGQAYSGRFSDDGMTGHISDFGVWTDDLAAFWAEWASKSAGPHVVVAHSMGGHIALRALAAHRIAPDAAVLTAPMLGLLPEWLPRSVLHLFARGMKALRGATSAAWRGAERPDAAHLDRFKLLTHDRERYADETWWRGERPALALGPPSWGWIERAFASMAELERPGVLEAVRTRILILATTRDRLVSWRATRKAAARLPNARLVTYGSEARHEILREADAARNAALGEIDAFLDSVVPPQ